MNPTFLIIQGGMGVGVSNWSLAKAVASRGQMGVVSGTGIATVLARRLHQGDPDGNLRRAADAFPFPAVTQRVWNRYFVPDGTTMDIPFKATAMPGKDFSSFLEDLTVLAAFTEVFLAKEGHGGSVGMNLLEKVQTPTLPTLFGAMLAGVDWILMGAGIPRFIPGALDALAAGRAFELKIDVEGAAPGEAFISRFDPVEFVNRSVTAGNPASPPPPLKRPFFAAIVSSATLAMTLARKSNGRVDGFIVETAIAGGHNAPPRGPLQLTDQGEPIYGPRDVADLKKIAELGLPFYLAGGFATPQQLALAKSVGAAGIQVGTAFAFCQESGISAEIKKKVIQWAAEGGQKVFTDPLASPTGFPFKVLELEDSISQPDIYAQRQRRCDLGYLRRAYRREDGSVGYRCAAEPVEDYLAKGGTVEETVGRKCLCNALFSTIGLGQIDAQGSVEAAIVTAGDEVTEIHRYIPAGKNSYSAADVLRYILGA